jgi:predicted GNAT superfamily acetyltransferase
MITAGDALVDRRAYGPLEMAEPHGIDVAAWFSEDERVVCSACARRNAIAARGGAVVFCFACGDVVVPASVPVNEALSSTSAAT